MLRRFLGAKIHRAKVTHVDVNYEGSITVPHNILEMSGILPYESVEVWNVTNGNRFQTYTITGNDESIFAVNGAAAHLCSPDDILIIASFVYLTSEMIESHKPSVVFLDDKNGIKGVFEEIAGPDKRI